jgi:hypothetical protein
MVRIKIHKLLFASIVFFAVEGCAMDRQNPETKILTGTIRVVGNEPFTKVVLALGPNPDVAAIDRDYLIIGRLRDSLRRNYQGKKLRVEGAYCTSPDPVYKKCFNPVRILADIGRTPEN